MKYQIDVMRPLANDLHGYTLAEGRLERNRQQALAVVARIERRLELERIINRSTDPQPMHSGKSAEAVDLLFRRTSDLYAPMATERRPTAIPWLIAAWAVALAVGIAWVVRS